ncbi:hypothetical protein DRH29_02555 [candidate division Kazan bacterium]|uniref:Uncharacterized protein n=1 Tax=candidate division Kazan bacterium TaxID=2202143 RepID=A0A420ZCS5_UNCK3|nr:MAG: hypothetical protein DRH29_02555 [candidate division Kazan bacterium]
MAENKKKRIQRKLAKVIKKFEKEIKSRRARNLDALELAERRSRRLAVIAALENAKRKLREQQDEDEDWGEIEQDIQSADDNMRRIDELDGIKQKESQIGGSESKGDIEKQAKKYQYKKPPKPKIAKPKIGVGAKTLAGGTSSKAAMGLALRNPYVLAAIGIVLIVILLIIGLIACSANKSYSEDGGSAFMELDPNNPEHQSAISQVRAAASDGSLALAANIQNDILGDNIYNLDYRIVQTLAYLSSKYRIGVNILYSNAPDYTYRQNVSKEAIELDDDKKSMDALSAYKLGQAVGINSIGTVSHELAEACDISGPVYVRWQETALEGTVRPVYEQLQVDASDLYVRASMIAEAREDNLRQQIDNAHSVLEKIQNNLNRLDELEKGFSGIQGYVEDALEYLNDVAIALGQEDWGNVDSELMAPVSLAVQKVFRIMQVANMDKWYKSTDNACQMWKAFEARQNIRRLVADIMQMPVELAGPEDDGFNNNFVVKQLIVYSPEDDLDNGPADWDVFPPGITSVGIGGVGIGSSEGGDGLVDYRDNHFMSLPIDNGVFSKACTEFVYNVNDTNSMMAQDMLAVLAPEGLRSEMCRLLYGDKKGLVEGKLSGLVSYKKFIHIGF